MRKRVREERKNIFLKGENFGMKRWKCTLEEICDIENCKLAIQKASRRKKRRKNVAQILENIDEYARRLSEFLQQEKPEFSSGERDVINEGTHKKRRELCKPVFFPDQCAHWAIMLIVSPYIERSLYTYTCASIPGRGTHYAKRAVERYMRNTKKSKYALQMDIKSYYASIDKEVLCTQLQNRIKDKRVVNLLRCIIYAYDGDGLPIGYYTSAWLANFYAAPIDRLVKEKIKMPLVRYMDNLFVPDGNKRKLHLCRQAIAQYAENYLHVRIKGDWQVYKTPYDNGRGKITIQRAIDFVGFKFYRYKTTIRKSIFKRVRKKMIALRKPTKRTVQNARSFMSYNGYLKHTDSRGVQLRYLDGYGISINKLKEIISNEDRNQSRKHGKTGTLCVQCVA